MNEIVKPKSTVPSTDGWDDTAAEAEARIIRGSLLKFNDWKWSTGKEKEWVEIKAGRCLVALATTAGWVKWQGGKPAEYRMRQPGVPVPEREALRDDDQSKWETGPDGLPRDPWQYTHFMYLIDPQTVEDFTFSTSSWGGRDCVINLAGQIKRMRSKYPDAVPLVELGAAPMSTRFGRKSKPVLKVMRWLNTTPPGVVESPQAPQPQLPPSTAAQELDDEIPF